VVVISLLAVGICCLVLPNLSAALLAAAPLRALFFALAFALALPACYFYFCDTSADACMLLHSHVCDRLRALFFFKKKRVAQAIIKAAWRTSQTHKKAAESSAGG
jgi:hypothetical protein